MSNAESYLFKRGITDESPIFHKVSRVIDSCASVRQLVMAAKYIAVATRYMQGGEDLTLRWCLGLRLDILKKIDEIKAKNSPSEEHY